MNRSVRYRLTGERMMERVETWRVENCDFSEKISSLSFFRHFFLNFPTQSVTHTRWLVSVSTYINFMIRFINILKRGVETKWVNVDLGAEEGDERWNWVKIDIFTLKENRLCFFIRLDPYNFRLFFEINSWKWAVESRCIVWVSSR